MNTKIHLESPRQQQEGSSSLEQKKQDSMYWTQGVNIEDNNNSANKIFAGNKTVPFNNDTLLQEQNGGASLKSVDTGNTTQIIGGTSFLYNREACNNGNNNKKQQSGDVTTILDAANPMMQQQLNATSMYNSNRMNQQQINMGLGPGLGFGYGSQDVDLMQYANPLIGYQLKMYKDKIDSLTMSFIQCNASLMNCWSTIDEATKISLQQEKEKILKQVQFCREQISKLNSFLLYQLSTVWDPTQVAIDPITGTIMAAPIARNYSPSVFNSDFSDAGLLSGGFMSNVNNTPNGIFGDNINNGKINDGNNNNQQRTLSNDTNNGFISNLMFGQQTQGYSTSTLGGQQSSVSPCSSIGSNFGSFFQQDFVSGVVPTLSSSTILNSGISLGQQNGAGANNKTTSPSPKVTTISSPDSSTLSRRSTSTPQDTASLDENRRQTLMNGYELWSSNLVYTINNLISMSSTQYDEKQSGLSNTGTHMQNNSSEAQLSLACDIINTMTDGLVNHKDYPFFKTFIANDANIRMINSLFNGVVSSDAVHVLVAFFIYVSTGMCHSPNVLGMDYKIIGKKIQGMLLGFFSEKSLPYSEHLVACRPLQLLIETMPIDNLFRFSQTVRENWTQLSGNRMANHVVQKAITACTQCLEKYHDIANEFIILLLKSTDLMNEFRYLEDPTCENITAHYRELISTLKKKDYGQVKYTKPVSPTKYQSNPNNTNGQLIDNSQLNTTVYSQLIMVLPARYLHSVNQSKVTLSLLSITKSHTEINEDYDITPLQAVILSLKIIYDICNESLNCANESSRSTLIQYFKHKCACRVFQKLFAVIPEIFLPQACVETINRHILHLAADQWANFVVQSMISNQNIYNATLSSRISLITFINNIATLKYGSHVFECLIEHSHEKELSMLYMSCITYNEFGKLLVDQYANYAIQHLIIGDSAGIAKRLKWRDVIAGSIKFIVNAISYEHGKRMQIQNNNAYSDQSLIDTSLQDSYSKYHIRLENNSIPIESLQSQKKQIMIYVEKKFNGQIKTFDLEAFLEAYETNQISDVSCATKFMR